MLSEIKVAMNSEVATNQIDFIHEPLLSILVITYNQAEYIKECLKGVFSQALDWKSVEVIISDDCSTDETQDAIVEVISSYPSVNVRLLINEQNIGVTRNIYRVLSEARGRYIAFIEGDDVWRCSEKCRMQIDYLQSNPTVAMVCGDINLIDENGDSLHRDHSKYQEYLYIKAKSKEFYEFMDIYFENFVFTCTTCFRRAAINLNILFKQIAHLYDAMLWLNVSTHGSVKYFDTVLSDYRVHIMGVSSSSEVKSSWQKIRISGSLDLMDKKFIKSHHEYCRYMSILVMITRDNKVSGRIRLRLLEHFVRYILEFPKYFLVWAFSKALNAIPR